MDIDVEVIKTKRANLAAKMDAATQQQAKLEQLLDNTERQVTALGGAIAVLDELIKEGEKGVNDGNS